MAQVGCGTSVAHQLISEAHRASAPGSIALRAGLEVDGGPVWTICPETEHLLFGPPAVRHQRLQFPCPLNKYTDSAERGGRFDADGCAHLFAFEMASFFFSLFSSAVMSAKCGMTLWYQPTIPRNHWSD